MISWENEFGLQNKADFSLVLKSNKTISSLPPTKKKYIYIFKCN